MWAIIMGHEEIADLLLPRSDYRTPDILLRAVRDKWTGIVEFILADPSANVNAENWEGHPVTAFGAAIEGKDVEVVQMFIQRDDLDINKGYGEYNV